MANQKVEMDSSIPTKKPPISMGGNSQIFKCEKIRGVEMSSEKFNWTYFKRRIYLNNCSKQELFRMWATPKGLTEWFIAKATYEYGNNQFRKPDETVQVGDKYHWTFHIGSTVKGEILDVKEDHLFRFTFGKKEPKSEENVIVTVIILEKDDKTWVDIIQENMAESKYGKVYYYISCNMGWVFHMNNLKSLIEKKHDLRVKGKKRMHVDAPSGYPLEQFEWTTFKQKEYFKAPLSDVFKKWATPKGLTEWFIAKTEYKDSKGNIRKSNDLVKPGDTYTWIFYQGLKITGKILEVVENKMFKFTFGRREPASDENVYVTVTFHDENDLTKIELFQENMADNDYGHVTHNLSCNLGWSYFMTNLRSVFESGLDLREKDSLIAKESRAISLAQ
jgi:uncharacterized protein YndB with AHSA1/START domain